MNAQGKNECSPLGCDALAESSFQLRQHRIIINLNAFDTKTEAAATGKAPHNPVESGRILIAKGLEVREWHVVRITQSLADYKC